MDTTLLDCAIARWLPKVGDPDVLSWVTVALYAAAAFVCLRKVRVGGTEPGRRRDSLFWTGAAILLALYAANKQLDLQSLLRGAGHCYAKREGWWQDRRSVQVDFVVAVSVAGALAVAAGIVWFRGSLARIWPAALGLALVAGYAMVRVVGISHVATVLETSLAGFPAKWILEIPGPLLVMAGASVSDRRGAG